MVLGSKAGAIRDGAARFRDKIDRELKAGVITLLLLLVVDRRGPAYGYQILKAVREMSAGRFEFAEGTAYPLLSNLERMGLVTSYWADGDAGPRRKYYQITATGKSALDGALDEWHSLSTSVDRVIRQVAKEERT